MKLAVIVFPGSNCDADLLWAVKEVMGVDAEFVRHDATSLAKFDGVLLPGGFSYGDYLRCGAIARFSPIINEVIRFATEIGLLPGTLLRNDSLRFICKSVPLKVNTHTKFTSEYPENVSIHLPVAHGEGNYYCDEKTLKELKEKNQIVFTYQEKVNGSLANIAGICNEQGNVLGMMPHPERAMEELLGSTDGRSFFASIVKNYGKELSQ